jgi:transketolase
MSALMEQPVKYIFSHDAFRVGEDGPTHQPVEHEAQMRLLEQMDNLSGRMSTLVLRPADGAETVECYRLAMNNWDSPTVLILTRQDVPDLPGVNRREAAKGVAKGAYTVISSENPKAVLVGNGSEVSLLVEVAEELSKEGINVNVVSIPSVGLFMHQSKEYQLSVLPDGVSIYGLTAGLPSVLYPIMKGKWKVYGLERFGSSAPYKVLDEKFGYTKQNILSDFKQFF